MTLILNSFAKITKYDEIKNKNKKFRDEVGAIGMLGIGGGGIIGL